MKNLNAQNRRSFLKAAAGLGLSYTASQFLLARDAWAVHRDVGLKSLFPVMQGMTTESSIQISVDVPEQLEVSFRLVGEKTGTVYSPNFGQNRQFKFSNWRVHQLRFSGLISDELYFFQIVDKEGAVLDEREACTLDLSLPNPRIALISCMWDREAHREMWSPVYDSDPDIIFFLGDNVYGDKGVKETPDNLRLRYFQTRQTVDFYHRRRLIPTIATWDDHDFGTNDGDKHYPYLNESTLTFNSFYAQEPVWSVYSKGPGISSSLKAFGMQFLFLDSRSFRDHKKDNTGSLLGELQKNWVFDKLSGFSGPTALICGSQFFGTVPFGASYEKRFEADLYGFLEEIRTRDSKVFFISGDIHRSETLNVGSEILGYDTYEITSSGLHTRVIPILEPNPNRRQRTRSRNFILAQPQITNDRLDINLVALGEESDLRFRDKISLDLS